MFRDMQRYDAENAADWVMAGIDQAPGWSCWTPPTAPALSGRPLGPASSTWSLRSITTTSNAGTSAGPTYVSGEWRNLLLDTLAVLKLQEAFAGEIVVYRGSRFRRKHEKAAGQPSKRTNLSSAT